MRFLELIFIFLFTLNSSAHDQIGAFDQKNLQKVQPYIQHLQSIRVYFGNSPAMGHQTHTYNLMVYLRSIGFKGIYEIIYDDRSITYLQNGETDLSTPQKMKYFFPDFNPHIETTQILRGGQIRAVPSSLFFKNLDQMPRLELGFTGGQDFAQLDAKKMKVQSFLDLYPSSFRGLHAEYLTLDEPAVSGKFNDAFSMFEEYSTPVFVETDFKRLKKELEASGVEPATSTQGVLDLLEGHPHQHFVPLYGLKGYSNLGRGFGAQAAMRIIKATHQAMENLPNPLKIKTSMLILNQLDVEEKEKFINSMRSHFPEIPIVDLNKSGSFTKGLESSLLTIYIVGGLPTPLFNHLVAISPFAVGGGANFKQLVQQLGKPYLDTQVQSLLLRNPPEEWVAQRIANIPVLKPEWQKAVYKIDAALSGIHYPSGEKSLVEFIQGCFEQRSDYKQIFQSIARPRPNKILAALSHAVHNLIHFKIYDEAFWLKPTEQKPKIKQCKDL